MKKLIAVAASAIAIGLTAAAPASAAELVTNGDFETGLTGWTETGYMFSLTAADYSPCCGVTGSEPSYSTDNFASFGPGNVSGGHSISQTFATVIGSLYSLSFKAGAFGGGMNVLQVSAGGMSNSYNLFSNNNADTTFANYSFNFMGTGLDTLTFAVDTGADNVDAILDGVSVIGSSVGAVPEPATWAMMLMGFFSLGAVLRRRPQLAPVLA